MSRFKPKAPKPPSAELLALKEFEGQIRHVTHESEDGAFKIVIFRTVDDEDIKAKGNLYGAAPGEPLRIKGSWREHATYGWTFQIESFLAITPTTENGLQAYLGSGLVKGIGPQTARRIVEHLGLQTLEILDNFPEALREIKGVSDRAIKSLVEQWPKLKAQREAMIVLKEVGLSNALALRLLRHYGETAVAILKANPYQAGLDVRHIGFMKADEIAERLGIATDSPLRIRAAFVHILDQASSDGHTCLPQEKLLENAVGLLKVDPALVATSLQEATEKGLVKCVKLADDVPHYFIPSLFKCESGVVKYIQRMLRDPKPLIEGSVDERIADFEKQYRFSLAPKQHDALRSVAAGGLCVITGGPGTGKTTLVRALLYIMKEQRLRLGLCSPTGRAAQRLSETTGQEASTVHRLLKWNAQTGGFTHGPDNQLPLDLLIVDESSMLDIPLAWALLQSLPPRITVVFVGDVDQLPSVGPGTFLRDLIESGRARTTRLDTIFRQAQASRIIQNAHRINQGHGLLPDAPDDPKCDFFFIDRGEPEPVRDALVAMATDRIPKRLNCDPIEGVQVLSPMRVGPLGTGELNRVLQDKLNPNGAPVLEGSRFRVGDKVIQISNNYDLDVYNGDVGLILGTNLETRELRVKYGRRVVAYPLENLDELELAYAITIHKSQGSEYQAVVVVIHTSHYVMLKRNLIYTAVTRGKRLVVIVGSKQALQRAIRTSTESERHTALGWWLTRPPESGDLFG